ncbi:hypothetical protein [Metallosphaera hakonensis]|uniref:Uncharacterized protein n=1 Tax=Metallosphaera hakonensis JCM 8857 = DSM 7519 TaxID=1293036 RepID=A0A2U9ISW4_9CREN|nr:hypothetical protein [Metallosphaera hakonensis]AWR99114.1 hypothetical protein DFR87_04720 [Metallosphaera hakonensis JCM 8857 = DSM 7519]
MNLQVKGRYLYVTMWDKSRKRPRRFYLGDISRREVWESLLNFAEKLNTPKSDLEDYLNFYVDKGTNMTKSEFVLQSLEMGELLRESVGRSEKVSEGV